MAKYINLLLVEDEAGTPFVIAAPAHLGSVGDLVSFCGGNLGTVVQAAFTDEESEAYTVFAAVTPIHDAEAIYRVKWKRETEDESP